MTSKYDTYICDKGMVALKWIRSTFEEDSKVMERYMQLREISALDYEAGLVAPQVFSI